MSGKKDNLLDHFEISDGEIDALMDELTRFSPAEAEPFFAEMGRTSARSGRTAESSTARAAAPAASDRSAGGNSVPRPGNISGFPASTPISRDKYSFDTPLGSATTAVPPQKAGKKHGFLWVLLILAVAIFVVSNIPEKGQNISVPKAAETVKEEVRSLGNSADTMIILRSAYYAKGVPQESLDMLASLLNCESVVLEDGDLILVPRDDRGTMIGKLESYFREDLTEWCASKSCPHFLDLTFSDDFSEAVITVNDITMFEEEKNLSDTFLLCGTVYGGLQSRDNAAVRIDFNNMLGQTIRVMDNG